MENDTTHVFADAWDALEENAEAAANMRLRSELMIAISGAVESWRAGKPAAAARLGIATPVLTNLLEGDIEAFSVDMLVTMAERAGLAVEVRIVPRAA